MGQSNAINSSFAGNPGWNGSVNSMKVNYRKVDSATNRALDAFENELVNLLGLH
jgi:hypothetical protein